MTDPNPEDATTWVRVDGTYALAVPRHAPLEEQRRLVERVTHALEALAQHGSTSAEESLAGLPLRPLEALRAAGTEVMAGIPGVAGTEADRLPGHLAPPEA